MSDRPSITCGHCAGVGRIQLPDHLWRVLECLDTVAGYTTPEILADLLLIYDETLTIPALCNRLKLLEGIGCAVKTKTVAPTGGCWYEWKKVEGQQ